MDALSLRDMVRASKLLGQSVSAVLDGPERELGMAALAAAVAQREHPDFTLDDALDLPMGDLVVVNATGEASAGSNGEGPQLLPATGA
jgi:hypothetical protein